MEKVIVSIDFAQFKGNGHAFTILTVASNLFGFKLSKDVMYLQSLERSKDKDLDILKEFSGLDFDCTIHRGRTMQEVIDSNPYSK